MFGRNLCANSTNINEKLSMQISFWKVSKERKSTLLTTERKKPPHCIKKFINLFWCGKKNGENQNIEITNECQYQIAMMYVHRTEAQHWCD